MERLLTLRSVPQEQCGPMNEDERRFFIVAMMQEAAARLYALPADLEHAMSERYAPALVEHAASKILLGRLKNTNQPYSVDAVAVACALSDRPGSAVAWAYTLFEEGRRRRSPYTVSDLAMDFPEGFPTHRGYSAYWEAQKGWAQKPPLERVDNILDLAETWKSPAEEVAA